MKRLLRALAWAIVIACLASAPALAEGRAEDETSLRMAAIFPGSIQDADYNTLGYIALQEAGNAYDIDVAYSEKVAVPDAERVLREYAESGFGVIWVHGAQFNGAAANVYADYPDTTFILELDDRPAELVPNFWYIERNYYTGFYVLGRLAALKTETGVIGFIGGLQLPFLTGEINAINQALDDAGSDAEFEYVFVGDFNDPVRARQAAEGLIAQGADVLISAVNAGNFGVYTAVKEAGRPVYITTTYTDKYDQAPESFMTSEIFDFTTPIQSIVGKVIDGEKGGYLLLEYGPGKPRYTQLPIRNVSDEINTTITTISEQVAAGEIVVEKNLSEIVPR
jgi:basic membrane protein A